MNLYIHKTKTHPNRWGSLQKMELVGIYNDVNSANAKMKVYISININPFKSRLFFYLIPYEIMFYLKLYFMKRVEIAETWCIVCFKKMFGHNDIAE